MPTNIVVVSGSLNIHKISKEVNSVQLMQELLQICFLSPSPWISSLLWQMGYYL